MYIEWAGEILANIGYGTFARRVIKGLMANGIKVKLIPMEHYVPESSKITDPFWIMKIAESQQMAPAPIRVNCCIPPVAQLGAGKNIGYFMWETDNLPKAWIPLVRRYNQVWTGSKFSSNIVSQHNPNVYTVYPPTESKPASRIELEGIDKDTILFTYVAMWIPRKNMEDLLTAFIAAFDGIDNVALVIKTWGGDNGVGFKQSVAQRVKDNIAGHIGIGKKPKLLLLNDVLPEQQVNNLIARTNVYVSPSRGEGFDLPLTEAMAQGKIVVANKFAAHSDYLTKENSLLYDYSLAPISSAMIPGYEVYQNWARPSIDSMIENMREAYNLAQTNNTALGDAAKKTCQEMFSVDKTVNTIKEALTKV